MAVLPSSTRVSFKRCIWLIISARLNIGVNEGRGKKKHCREYRELVNRGCIFIINQVVFACDRIYNRVKRSQAKGRDQLYGIYRLLASYISCYLHFECF